MRPGEELQVAHFFAYVLHRDGRFEDAIEFDCANEEAAIEVAKQHVNGCDVELWHYNRRIIQLKSDHPD